MVENLERSKRRCPCGVRSTEILPAFSHLRSVAWETPKCLAAAVNPLSLLFIQIILAAVVGYSLRLIAYDIIDDTVHADGFGHVVIHVIG